MLIGRNGVWRRENGIRVRRGGTEEQRGEDI